MLLSDLPFRTKAMGDYSLTVVTCHIKQNMGFLVSSSGKKGAQLSSSTPSNMENPLSHPLFNQKLGQNGCHRVPWITMRQCNLRLQLVGLGFLNEINWICCTLARIKINRRRAVTELHPYSAGLIDNKWIECYWIYCTWF